MFKLTLVCVLTLLVLDTNAYIDWFEEGQDPTKIHALLISAVPCDGYDDCPLNYAPESETAQTYHLLLEFGVPADNIILFMNGQIANNTDINPFPGTLYTDLNKSRNWNEGLRIDYSGDDVNVENYMAVLAGDAEKVKGGSGRVLKSTEEDRVLISHEGHGKTGSLVIVNRFLTVKKLNDTLNTMQEKKMFKELVYYVMACRSGSMFHGHLDENGKIYAVTAVKPEEDARPKDQITEGEKYICVNTEFGDAWHKNWMSKNTKTQTLEEQYKDMKDHVASSTVTQHGNLKIASEAVSNFEGISTNKTEYFVESKPYKSNQEDSIPISPIAPYLLLKRKLEAYKDKSEPKELRKKLDEMEKELALIKSNVNSMIASLTSGRKLVKNFYQPPQVIWQMDCHDEVMEFVDTECKNFRKSIFIDSLITPLANLCEQGLNSKDIISKLRQFC